jgi:hypothetical protein
MVYGAAAPPSPESREGVPMTTRVFHANDGNDRLVVSTIRTRLVFFHEAGVSLDTERRVAVRPVWWQPATWRGFHWRRSDEAEQPRNLRCLFNGRWDAAELGATSQSSPGHFKLSCDSLAIRRHCVWVVQGDGPRSDSAPSIEGRAAAVRDIELRFEYGGQMRTVRHVSAVGRLLGGDKTRVESEGFKRLKAEPD